MTVAMPHHAPEGAHTVIFKQALRRDTLLEAIGSALGHAHG